MVPLQKTPHEVLQEDLDHLAFSILENSYKKVSIEKIDIKEDLKEGVTDIKCVLLIGKEEIPVSGRGRGMVDALFTALLEEVKKKYSSLNNIELLDFAIEADFRRKRIKKKINSDVEVETRLLLKGSDSDRFIFRHHHTSMITSAAVVVTKVIEYFINSEEAVISLYKSIIDAEKRNRGDLVSTFTLQLSELVKNVSYEERLKTLSEGFMSEEVD